MSEVAVGDAIRRDLLTPSDVFILDDGFEVFVWLGKSASAEERRKAMAFGNAYLQQYARKVDTPVSKVFEGGENELFEVGPPRVLWA